MPDAGEQVGQSGKSLHSDREDCTRRLEFFQTFLHLPRSFHDVNNGSV